MHLPRIVIRRMFASAFVVAVLVVIPVLSTSDQAVRIDVTAPIAATCASVLVDVTLFAVWHPTQTLQIVHLTIGNRDDSCVRASQASGV